MRLDAADAEVGMSLLLLRPTMMMTTQECVSVCYLLPLPGELYWYLHLLTWIKCMISRRLNSLYHPLGKYTTHLLVLSLVILIVC